MKASTDRSVPKEFVGTLEPNYYCRRWNPKRSKYCRARAGFGTQHPGVGRCRKHGGVARADDARLKHGQYRSIEAPEIRELLEEMRDTHADPLDVAPDIQRSRAITVDFVRRLYAGELVRNERLKQLHDVVDAYEAVLTEQRELSESEREQLAGARDAIASLAIDKAIQEAGPQAVKMHEDVSKMVHRVQMLKTAGAVSLDQVRRFLAAVDRELQRLVADEQLREKLRNAFYDIRV